MVKRSARACPTEIVRANRIERIRNFAFIFQFCMKNLICAIIYCENSYFREVYISTTPRKIRICK
jgi:hypothetical protein